MTSLRRILGVTAFLVVLQFAGRAHAGVGPLNPSPHVNPDVRQGTISLTFDHPPDLSGTNAVGRPFDNLQVEISGMQNSAPLSEVPHTTRGEQLHFSGTLPMRTGAPSPVDPRGGGWEGLIGGAPFTASGDVVTFTAPLSKMASDDGRFAYEASTTNDGQIIADTQVQAVPLPLALPIAAIVLIAVVLIRWGAAQHGRVTVRAVRIVRK